MDSKRKVLIVDDEKPNRRILSKILSEDYEVLEADNGATALQMLQKPGNHIDVVLLDLLMPEFDGFDFLRVFSETGQADNIPVVVTTGDDNPESEKKCLELGAWDFVKKPYDATVLKLRVKSAIERNNLHVLQELRYKEQFDKLTGIYKGETFRRETRKMLEEHPDITFAMVRMDIHKFQVYNSFFGMIEGDHLLKYVASLLQKYTQHFEFKTYCRKEADVFYICLPYKGKERSQKVLEQMREDLRNFQKSYELVPVFGIYVIQDRSASIREMMDYAKMAADTCKENYVQNYAYYNQTIQDEILQSQMVVNKMKRALKEEQFVLYLQPKYSLADNKIQGAEVLVRWEDPEKGLLPPGMFIPIFEHNGFIMELDYYVWEHSCQLLRRWIDEGRQVYPISVNISRVSLYNPNLVEDICELVKRYNIPTELFQLELTETAYASNPTQIWADMSKLQQKGFTILMDDFGSGYSSLNVLKDINVDVLKLDMKFLTNAADPVRSHVILKAVVHMAKDLDIPCIAEGVEQVSQADFLKKIGCEYVQGYLYAKPMPVKDYEALVDAGGHLDDLPSK